MYIPEDTEVVLCSDSGRKLLLNTGGVHGQIHEGHHRYFCHDLKEK